MIEIMEEQTGVSTAKDLVDAVLQSLLCCPFCHEGFVQQQHWNEHITRVHSEKLNLTHRKRVAFHHVEEDTQKILVCPHCHYAVSEAPGVWALTDITSHVEKNCRFHRRDDGISFFTSSDPQLIALYLRGEVEIEIRQCPLCNETFGKVEPLVTHIQERHSYAGLQDLSVETVRFLKEQAGRIVNETQSPSPTQIVQPPVEELPPEISLPLPLSQPDTTVMSGSPAPPPAATPARPQPAPELSVGTLFSRIIPSVDICVGVLCLPPRLSHYLRLYHEVTVQFRPDWRENLRFDCERGRLSGMAEWYRVNAIEPGDKVRMRLADDTRPIIEIWTEWEKHENYVLRCPPEDFKWRHLSIRDCLLRVLHVGSRPMHYRELYAQISQHRQLQVGSVIGVLSKYRDVLFQHVGQGEWAMLPEHSRRLRVLPVEMLPKSPADDEIIDWPRVWGVVEDIEKDDIVYRLLQRVHEDMGFDRICQSIAQQVGIDWRALSRAGFMNVHDRRLRRLSNGNFALEEWFVPPVSPVPGEPPRRPDEWYLKTEDGTVYGPMPLKTLQQCAEECRIAPDHQVSRDRKTWVLAKDIEELGMVCFVQLQDGSEYGPIHPSAVAILKDSGDILTVPGTTVADPAPPSVPTPQAEDVPESSVVSSEQPLSEQKEVEPPTTIPPDVSTIKADVSSSSNGTEDLTASGDGDAKSEEPSKKSDVLAPREIRQPRTSLVERFWSYCKRLLRWVVPRKKTGISP